MSCNTVIGAGPGRRFFYAGRFAMAPKKKEFAPELIAEAKRLYEQTLATVDDIAAMLGVGHTMFYRIARREGWRGRHAKVATFQFARALSGTAVATMAPTPAPAQQPRAEVGVTADPLSPEQRLAMALRIQRVVEREMDAMERILAVIQPADLIEAEHGARTLAGVSRALREIKALTEPDEVTPPDDADDDPIPLDIDEYREAHARRIRGFIEARRNGVDRIPDQRKPQLD
jgi:hypothetical protein